jgi:hypothetical protein
MKFNIFFIIHLGLCLLVCSRLNNFFSFLAAITIAGDRATNLDLWLVHMATSSDGSFSRHTYCNTGPQFMRSYAKDWHPYCTVGFQQGTQGSLDICASALTTAPGSLRRKDFRRATPTILKGLALLHLKHWYHVPQWNSNPGLKMNKSLVDLE